MRRISPRSIISSIGLSVCFLFIIFIVNNLTTHSTDPEPFSVKCNCPKIPPQIITQTIPKEVAPGAPKLEPLAAAKVDPVSVTTPPPPLPPCKPVEYESPVQRAIIIYYPHHQSEYFFPEVRW